MPSSVTVGFVITDGLLLLGIESQATPRDASTAYETLEGVATLSMDVR